MGSSFPRERQLKQDISGSCGTNSAPLTKNKPKIAPAAAVRRHLSAAGAERAYSDAAARPDMKRPLEALNAPPAGLDRPNGVPVGKAKKNTPKPRKRGEAAAAGGETWGGETWDEWQQSRHILRVPELREGIFDLRVPPIEGIFDLRVRRIGESIFDRMDRRLAAY